jgi:hypothetical protein
LGLIIGMGTDCKSALSYIRDFLANPSDRDTEPKVKAAGTIDFRGGKIYKVDNASGHYKPSVESLKKAEEVFRKKFAEKSFTNDFKGFLPYEN